MRTDPTSLPRLRPAPKAPPRPSDKADAGAAARRLRRGLSDDTFVKQASSKSASRARPARFAQVLSPSLAESVGVGERRALRAPVSGLSDGAAGARTKLGRLLDDNPDVRTNQDLINHFYGRTDGTWGGAAAMAGDHGVDLNDLVADRQGDPRALPAAGPSSATPSPSPSPSSPASPAPGAADPSQAAQDAADIAAQNEAPYAELPPEDPDLGDNVHDKPSGPSQAEQDAADIAAQNQAPFAEHLPDDPNTVADPRVSGARDAVRDALAGADHQDREVRRQAIETASTTAREQIEALPPSLRAQAIDRMGPELERIGAGIPELGGERTDRVLSSLSRLGAAAGNDGARRAAQHVARGTPEGVVRDGAHASNAGQYRDAIQRAVERGDGAGFGVALAEQLASDPSEDVRDLSAGLAIGVKKAVDTLVHRTDVLARERDELDARVGDMQAVTSNLLHDDERARGAAAFADERAGLVRALEEPAAALADATQALTASDLSHSVLQTAGAQGLEALARTAGTTAGDEALAALGEDGPALERAVGLVGKGGADELGAAIVQGTAAARDFPVDVAKRLGTAVLNTVGGPLGGRTRRALSLYDALRTGDLQSLASQVPGAGADLLRAFGKGGLAAGLGKASSVIGGAFDAWEAAHALGDGDYARASVLGAGALGSALALAGVGGPAGAALGFFGALGGIALDVRDATRRWNDRKNDWSRFLDAAVDPGLRERAGPLLELKNVGAVNDAFGRVAAARSATPQRLLRETADVAAGHRDGASLLDRIGKAATGHGTGSSAIDARIGELLDELFAMEQIPADATYLPDPSAGSADAW